MADFRRWVTALAVLALFAGLAGAQTGSGGTQAMVCNQVAQVTPTLRSEGITELVGDIVITCSGGNYITPGSAIPQANLIVSLTAPVTSRLLSSSASTGVSEALLMIDEPNSGLAAPVPGFGPAAGLNVCTSTTGGCVEYAVAAPSNPAIAVAVDTPTGTTPGKNVFLGVVSGNQVTFAGIPVLPPVTSGVQRVYRITNIRVNATGAGSSVVSGVQPVYAYLSASGSTSLPVSSASVTVGFVQTSLSVSVTNDKAAAPPSGTQTTTTNVNSFTQCNPLNLGNVAFLNFTENFPSAFKTRFGVNPNTGNFTSSITSGSSTTFYSYLGTTTGGANTQNVPGTLYNSESGFVLGPVTIGQSTFTPGQADSGTRFQAVFNNLPSGATVYVSKYSVTSFTTSSLMATGITAPGTTTGNPSVPVAVMTSSGAFSAPKAATGLTGNAYDLVALSPTNGTATAIWEITNTNTSANETASFAVFISYTPDLTNNTPTPGNAATVTLSYNPIGTGSLPANPNWIPRFIQGPASVAMPLLNIAKCNTVLLFPYITAAAGFDTGIAISNTSKDPLTPATGQSTGSCNLSFYGANAPTGTVAPLGPIPAGNGSDPTKFAFMLSTVAPNFTGYMFAVCDFQFAHGFAFISDIGTRNLAMGYLALVVNPGGQISRPALPSGESLTQ